MLKRCPEHGAERVLMADDVDYYRRCREVFLKPPEMPLRFNTPMQVGLPVRLRPVHRSRAALVPVAGRDHRPLQPALPDLLRRQRPVTGQEYPRRSTTIERMLDAVVRNEGEPDVVQISGGEPTLHPDFFAILDARQGARRSST